MTGQKILESLLSHGDGLERSTEGTAQEVAEVTRAFMSKRFLRRVKVPNNVFASSFVLNRKNRNGNVSIIVASIRR